MRFEVLTAVMLKIQVSGMLRYVTGRVVASVLKGYTAFTFSVNLLFELKNKGRNIL